VEFVPDSFCAVAGLQLQPQRAAAKTECCVGDALTMTPPVTGNGMSMAFESAEMAVEPLAAYSRGGMSWEQARQETARRCDAAFARRLAWARRLQSLMISPLLQGWLGARLLRSEVLWRLMFARTR
jgi:flavin-dependent dehydrogenase